MTPKLFMQEWPKIGDKLKFTGLKPAFHTNVIENGGKLKFGEYYTVRGVDVASSWCCIFLEEFPATEKFGEDWFSLAFFEWPNKGINPPMDPLH